MNKISYSFSLLLLFLTSIAFAQEKENKAAAISFSKTSYDFGTIKEQDGEVKVDFEFENIGDSALVLKSVEASCGCTTPTWTQDSIMPGESGVVQIAYNPLNRPGPFNKTVTVTSNGNPSVSVLSIEGMVVPTVTDLSAQYPYKVGGLQFRKKSLHFGNITNEKPVTRDIEAYNGTDKIIAFSGNSLKPAHITISYEPQAIDPGQVGLIHVTYDAQKSGRLGYTSDNVALYTYELQDSVKQFNVFATVLDYFPPLKAEELATVPKINVDKTIFDFGNSSPHDILKTEFLITNEGKEPLQFKKIASNCSCVKVSTDKSILKAGETATLFATFEVSATPGTQQKSITIFSNDPTAAVQVLTLKTYVRD